MAGQWNEECEPPWSMDELTLKIRNAYRYARGKIAGQSISHDFEDEVPTDYGTQTKPTSKKPFVLFDDWVWIAQTLEFVRRRDKKRFSPKSFDSMFNHLTEKGNISTAIFNSNGGMRKFMGYTYEPGEPEFLEELELYNLWTPTNLKPIEGADVGWFIDHLNWLTGGNTKEVDYILPIPC
jgi:hypothetical protein